MKLLIAGSRSIKNFDLSKYVSPDVDLIIWDGSSKGTEYTMRYAKKKEKEITVVEVRNN